MFCLYHFSVKCIIKTNYLLPYGPLNPNVSWDTLVEETRGRPISREDRARNMVCYVKPTYSSYFDLLNLSLSNTSSSAASTTHSGQDEDPLQDLLQELDIQHVDWNALEVIPDEQNVSALQLTINTLPDTPEDIIINIPGQDPILVQPRYTSLEMTNSWWTYNFQD